jgi:hypothetical protein
MGFLQALIVLIILLCGELPIHRFASVAPVLTGMSCDRDVYRGALGAKGGKRLRAEGHVAFYPQADRIRG